MTGSPAAPPRALAPHLAALAAVTLWGLSFVATKVALAEIAPATLVFTRFAIGSGILFALMAASRTSARISASELPTLLLMGFVGVFVHQMLQVFGVNWTTATNAGWLIGVIPVWSALLAALFLAERPTWLQALGLALGLLGAVLIIGGDDPFERILNVTSSRGDLLVIASTLNWAVYTVLGRRWLRDRNGLRTAAYSMAFGSMMLAVPFFLSRPWGDYRSVTAAGWSALLFLGVGCSAVGYLCWLLALRRLQASRVAAYLYLEPLVTQLGAVVVLREMLRPVVIVGGITVLVGVLFVQRRSTVA